MIFNNVCYHCGSQLVYGRWGVNVFKAEHSGILSRGTEMLLCPKCGIGWEMHTSNEGQRYPSFVVDGHEWRGPINQWPAVQSSKEPPMPSRWIPVHRLADGQTAVPYWADTASEAIFSIRLTCACGQNHHFEGRGGSPVWVCEDCGRVYRATATFAVERHMGDGR